MHAVWLEAQVAEKEKPSLPKLYKYEVPEKVGAQYAKFREILLDEMMEMALLSKQWKLTARGNVNALFVRR